VSADTGVSPSKSIKKPSKRNHLGPSLKRARNSTGGVTEVQQLRADSHNRRLHPPRNVAMLTAALKDVGAARSIVIDEDDVVIAGNGVLDAAGQAGIERVKVIEADGQTLIAVRRRGLTAEQKRRLAMYDNRTAELAVWNPDQLAADLKDGLDLVPFFNDPELAAILQTEEGATRQRLAVARPSEVAWVLVAIPLAEWPKAQPHVEQLQSCAVFTTMALRPKKDDEEEGRQPITPAES
jgi:hypothetical protein